MFKAKLTIPPIDAALKYARKGWRIIPLHSVNKDGSCTCRNDKCSSQGKHPLIPAWQKAATSDPKIINSWFTKWPSANIGGAESGLAILDIDPRHGGEESLALLEQQLGELPETATVATGGGGFHYYFRYPQEKLGNRTGFRPGLDFKITGGYVVAPPSEHVSGKKYEWLEKDFPLVEMPKWLIMLRFLCAVELKKESLPGLADSQYENNLLNCA